MAATVGLRAGDSDAGECGSGRVRLGEFCEYTAAERRVADNHFVRRGSDND